MTVQQHNCYETATLKTQVTNEAELSESDKQEFTAEDNSLFFVCLFVLLSSFVKEKSTQMVAFYGAKTEFLKENLAELKGCILFLCLRGLQCNQSQGSLWYCLK